MARELAMQSCTSPAGSHTCGDALQTDGSNQTDTLINESNQVPNQAGAKCMGLASELEPRPRQRSIHANKRHAKGHGASDANVFSNQSSHQVDREVPVRRRKRRTSASHSRATVARRSRRSRSLSPTRSCPKLLHTQGRLDMDVTKLHFCRDVVSCCCFWLESHLILDECAVISENLRSRSRSQESHALRSKTICAAVPAASLNFTLRRGTAPRNIGRSKTYQQPKRKTQTHHPHQRQEQQEAPGLQTVKRVLSSTLPASNHHLRRFKLFYRDESLRTNWSQNTLELIQTAQQTQIPRSRNPANEVSPSSSRSMADDRSIASANMNPSDKSRFFALKALKYRRLWDKVERLDLDVQDSSSARETCLMQCLGVEWCKVETT